MHAIGATLTSGGGTLLICVHRFTVAFAARDDTRQRASVFRMPDCACAMPSSAHYLLAHPHAARMPDVPCVRSHGARGAYA